MDIAAPHPRVQRALDVDRDPGQAEAALLGDRQLVGEPFQLRVDDRGRGGVEPRLHDQQAVHDPELGRRQAHAKRVAHDRDHLLGLALELRPEARQLRGPRLQHRVPEGPYLGERRRPALARLRSSSATASSPGPSGLSGCSSRRAVGSGESLIGASVGQRAGTAAHCGSTSTLTAAPRSCAARGEPLDRLADGGHRLRSVLGLDQQLTAVAAAQPEAGSRPQELGAGGQPARQRPANPFGDRLDALGLGGRQLDPDQVREGRIAKRSAPLELAGEEALGVVGRRVADRRGLGRQGLDQHPAAPLAAPAAPGELGHEREGALLGAEVGEAKRRVGVEHHAQHHIGEVVSLGDHLGADQDARLRLLEAAQDLGDGRPRWAALSESRRNTGRGATASSSRVARRSVPGAVAGEGDRAALGARLRDRLGVAAVVTLKALLALVEDQRDLAVGALEGVPAGSAADERRPATPVEEDDRLGARLADLGERLQRARVKRARPGRAATQVHDLDRRQLAAVGPARQLEPPQAQPALGPGRGAAGEQRRPRFARPVAGHLARVVARIALLLVGGVVLLVDHHQAEVAHRGEDRRARADADPRLARVQALPLVAALARRQPRVEQRHAVAEPRREPRDRLGRQPDLGNEHDRALPPLERRLGGRQVDLGLARARDPVQQVLAAGAAVHRRDDRLDRRASARPTAAAGSTGRRPPPPAGAAGVARGGA